MKKKSYLLVLSVTLLLSGCVFQNVPVVSEIQTCVDIVQEQSETKTEQTEPKQETQTASQEETTSVNETVSIEENEELRNEAALKVFDKYIGKEHGAYDLIEKKEEEILLNGVIEVTDSKIIGQYERTKCIRGIGGEITISKKDDNTLVLDGEVTCYAACGSFDEDIVYNLSDTKGFVVSDIDYGEESAHSVFFMERRGEELICTQMGEFAYMGVGVDADGIFTQGEPEYTNDNIVAETFSPETIAILKQLFEENQLDYNDYIENQMLYGTIDSSDVTMTFSDGTKKQGVYHYIWLPHAACFTVNMFVAEDGHVYMTADVHAEEVFMTDDKNVTEMPTDK